LMINHIFLLVVMEIWGAYNAGRCENERHH